MELTDTRSDKSPQQAAQVEEEDSTAVKTEIVVETKRTSFNYGSRLALQDVELKVPRASVFGLLGPNGGGKTTLIKILITLLRPTSGSACVAGADVVTRPNDVRRRIGVVFQRPSLDVKLTVLENLVHQGHLYGLSGPALRRRSETLLEQFRVADRAHEPVEHLSGGLQRRVELAKAMLHGPEVLILDEPSSGLDPSARMTLMDHLHTLRDEHRVTSLLTTHLTDEADRCDRLAILDEGRLVACGTPSDLKAAIGGDVITMTTDAPAILAKKLEDRFEIPAEVLGNIVRIERAHGHAFVADLIEAFPGEIETVTVGKPTLNDVFLHRTGHALDGDEIRANPGE